MEMIKIWFYYCWMCNCSW